MGNNSWNGYERNCLFANDGGTGQFIDITRASGGDEVRDSRGVAIADFNNDGRLDIAINNNNAEPALYWNRLNGGQSLRLELVGRESNRDAIGARVSVTLADADGAAGKTLTRWVEAGSGYASQAAHALHFGLGPATEVQGIEVRWPSGHVDRFDGEHIALNTHLWIEEAGEVLAQNPVPVSPFPVSPFPARPPSSSPSLVPSASASDPIALASVTTTSKSPAAGDLSAKEPTSKPLKTVPTDDTHIEPGEPKDSGAADRSPES